MTYLLKPGDWIGSIGKSTWRDPWNWPLYRAMHEYEKARYPWSGAETRITHVRIVIPGGRFFEQTTPVSRILPLNDPETDLAGKFAQGRIRVARWPKANAPNEAELARHADFMKGMTYDYGDLLDFALTGLTGAWWWLLKKGPIRIFGDKAGRFAVCSVAGAALLERSGVRFPVSVWGIDPAWPFNQADTGAVRCPSNITNLFSKESFQ